MSYTLYIVAIAVVVATLLPFSRSKRWWIRAMDFPRIQILGLIVLWLMAALVLYLSGTSVSVVMFTGVLLCGIYQAYRIHPYTRWARAEVPACSSKCQKTISLLTSNVLMENRNANALIQQIESYQPDIVVTLESDQWWQDQLATLSRFPHKVQYPLDNRYGIHLFSRLPLKEAHVDFLVDNNIPSICARVEVDSNTEIRLHAIHPTPPAPGENDSSLDRDVELLVLAGALQDSKEKIVVMGDLNDVAWSRTTRQFRKVSGLLDPRIGRGLINSFNADYRFLGWPLDHVFTSSHFRVVELKRLPSIDSDHFPLFAKLQISDDDVFNAKQHPINVDEEDINATLETDVAKKSMPPSIN